MADLPESAEWTEGVYQLETSDPVLGGPDGIDNLQAKQLASRTKWLKDQIGKIIDGTSGVGKALQLKTARTLKFKGAATGSGSYDGSADTEIALTLADISWNKIASDKPTTLGGYGIKDTYTKLEVESMITQATEVKLGTAKVATQELVEAGTNDETIVTPAKIKFGYSAMFAITGWIRLPKFLGGLTLSWQQVTASSAGLTVTLPIAVANKFFGTWAQHLGPKGGPAYAASVSFDDAAKNTVNVTSSVSGAAAFTIFVLSY